MEELERQLRQVVKPVLKEILNLWKQKFHRLEVSDVMNAASSAFEEELTNLRSAIELHQKKTDLPSNFNWSVVLKGQSPKREDTNQRYSRGHQTPEQNDNSESKEHYTVSDNHRTAVKGNSPNDSLIRNQVENQFKSSSGPQECELGFSIEKLSLESEEEVIYWLGQAKKCGSTILEELSKRMKCNFDVQYTEGLRSVNNEMKR